jgi:hypothetical protein
MKEHEVGVKNGRVEGLGVRDCSGTREEDEPDADLSVRDAGPERDLGNDRIT